MGARRLLAPIVVAILIAGCASGGVPSSSRGRQDRLTRDQIMAVNVTSLFDVIQRLRPRWLQPTGGEPSSLLGMQATGTVVVYQGQSFLGGIDVLRELAPEMAYELRYLDGPTAQATLPGLGNQLVSGAIVIHTSAR
ncbi:MAG TPA: hypothetical protein VF158_11530 [Longimicrobiales bacterium]